MQDEAEPIAKTHEIVRVRTHGGERFVAVAAGAVGGVARSLDFGEADAERLRSLVDGLCRDVVEHHFDDPAEADFTVIVGERRGALWVRIEDRGLPYPVDCFTLDDQSLIGRIHAAGGAESIRFESSGLRGNAVELTVRQSPDQLVHLDGDEHPGTKPVDNDAEIVMRPLTREDAPGLARCMYRCYGYTYANDFVYYPDQVLSLIERGLMRSMIGVDAEGEVVGHSGLIRDHADSRVAESGMAVVDPRYRNHHLMGSLKQKLMGAALELGLIATYADAVAVHEYTQKANVAIGAREAGLLLAEIPEFTTFRGFDPPRQRGSVVVFFHPLADLEPRQLFVPSRYRSLIESIYGRLRLLRTFREAAPGDAPAVSAIHVEVKARRGLARIEVESAGRDVVTQVAQRFHELCVGRLDVIHLDLPLADAPAMAAVDELAGLGFFFAAIIPELWGGDVLRLQYLNNIDLDPGSIVLYSDEAKRLLDAILDDRG
jgi:serine/threonine-protein kinase RsbW